MLRVLLAVLGLSACVGTGGCVRVKPYQREHLAVPAMDPGADAVANRFRQHWQTSREGSTGGYGAAGGGCGCN